MNTLYKITNTSRKRCIINTSNDVRLKSLSASYQKSSNHSFTTVRYQSKETNSYVNLQKTIKDLNKEERSLLLIEIEKYNKKEIDANSNDSSNITNDQAMTLFFINCVPFIGFGFFDNLIMIVAGEYIDLKLGMVFGISTMAAAALGNLISDCFGVQLSVYIESWCLKLGLKSPYLSLKQSELKKTRFIVALGKLFGITIGCIIGMFPLLFSSYDDKKE